MKGAFSFFLARGFLPFRTYLSRDKENILSPTLIDPAAPLSLVSCLFRALPPSSAALQAEFTRWTPPRSGKKKHNFLLFRPLFFFFFVVRFLVFLGSFQVFYRYFALFFGLPL